LHLSPTEKIAEAGRKFTALKNELHVAGSLKVGPSLSTLATSRKVTLSPEPSNKVKVKTKKKVNQLKFAFGEFYLSLILLQNYQVGLCHVRNWDQPFHLQPVLVELGAMFLFKVLGWLGWLRFFLFGSQKDLFKICINHGFKNKLLKRYPVEAMWLRCQRIGLVIQWPWV